MSDNVSQWAITEAVYFILLSMLEPRHGYAVMQDVERLTKGRVNLWAGTLYGAINTLLEKQWIRVVGGGGDSRRKEYVITDRGRKVLHGELARLEELLIIGTDKLERAES